MAQTTVSPDDSITDEPATDRSELKPSTYYGFLRQVPPDASIKQVSRWARRLLREGLITEGGGRESR